MTPEEVPFDESDQASLIQFLKLPKEWIDNRPFEERFNNFGLFVPTGLIDGESPITITYTPNA
jgi:hypothetical protein